MVRSLALTDEFALLPFADTSVQLQGIEPLSFDKDEDDSFVACFRRHLKACGRDLPYWLLMGASGAAFRLQVHSSGWRLVSLDAACGQNLLPDLYDLCNLDLEERWICAGRERNAAAKEIILKHLEAGRPVIGLGLDSYTRYGLVTGMRPGGVLIAQDYTLSFYPHPVAEDMVWCYLFGAPRGLKSPTREELFRRGVRKALELGASTKVKGYYQGQTAYDYWYSTLVNPMHHDPLSEDWRAHERNEGNYKLYTGLIHARRQAARFLRELALFKPACAVFADAAAETYEMLAAELQPLLDEHVVRPAAHIGVGRPWTIRERRKQAKALRRASDLELRAIPLLEALRALLEPSQK